MLSFGLRLVNLKSESSRHMSIILFHVNKKCYPNAFSIVYKLIFNSMLLNKLIYYKDQVLNIFITPKNIKNPFFNFLKINDLLMNNI